MITGHGVTRGLRTPPATRDRMLWLLATEARLIRRSPNWAVEAAPSPVGSTRCVRERGGDGRTSAVDAHPRCVKTDAEYLEERPTEPAGQRPPRAGDEAKRMSGRACQWSVSGPMVVGRRKPRSGSAGGSRGRPRWSPRNGKRHPPRCADILQDGNPLNQVRRVR